MRTIIAGSRSITSANPILRAIEQAGWVVTEIVSGHARGIDQLGEQIGNFLKIPVRIFPAEWDKYGKSAGYRRNEEMAQYAEALIAIWDGKSRGTKHMIDIAKRRGLRVYVYMAKPTELPVPNSKTGI